MTASYTSDTEFYRFVFLMVVYAASLWWSPWRAMRKYKPWTSNAIWRAVQSRVAISTGLFYVTWAIIGPCAVIMAWMMRYFNTDAVLASGQYYDFVVVTWVFAFILPPVLFASYRYLYDLQALWMAGIVVLATFLSYTTSLVMMSYLIGSAIGPDVSQVQAGSLTASIMWTFLGLNILVLMFLGAPVIISFISWSGRPAYLRALEHDAYVDEVMASHRRKKIEDMIVVYDNEMNGMADEPVEAERKSRGVYSARLKGKIDDEIARVPAQYRSARSKTSTVEMENLGFVSPPGDGDPYAVSTPEEEEEDQENPEVDTKPRLVAKIGRLYKYEQYVPEMGKYKTWFSDQKI